MIAQMLPMRSALGILSTQRNDSCNSSRNRAICRAMLSLGQLDRAFEVVERLRCCNQGTSLPTQLIGRNPISLSAFKALARHCQIAGVSLRADNECLAA